MGKRMERFWEKLKSIHKRKILCVLLIILLLLIPTFMALIDIYRTNNNITIYSAEKLTVDLNTADGTLVASEEASAEYVSTTSLVGLFQWLNESKIKSTKSAAELSDRQWVKATYHTVESTFDLTCYFSLSANDSYCVDQNGQVYRIEQDVCDRFFSTKYAEPFYSSSVLPTLTTANGEAVLPTLFSWKYQNRSGEFTDTYLNKIAEGNRSYDMQGAVSLSFSKEPDECAVQVYNEKNKLIYEGDYHALQTLVGSSLHMKITALWKQTDDSTFFGSATYDFRVKIRDHAIFTVNTDTVMAGEAVLLTCTNISDLSRLSFTENKSSTCKPSSAPIFYQENGIARAWLVFPSNTQAGEYYFTVSYGAASQNITLTVLPSKDLQPVVLERTEEELANLPLKEINKHLQEISNKLTLPSDRSVYFPGKFQSPLVDGFREGYASGTPLTSSDGMISFLAFGNEYLLTSNTASSIGALNSGLVIQTGNSVLLGNYVVVDHGLGLRTWYCHLSTFDVRTGDYVVRGQSVGKAGQHATASEYGFLLLCSIEGQFLTPSFLYSE